jgi:hypothetical protein
MQETAVDPGNPHGGHEIVGQSLSPAGYADAHFAIESLLYCE